MGRDRGGVLPGAWLLLLLTALGGCALPEGRQAMPVEATAATPQAAAPAPEQAPPAAVRRIDPARILGLDPAAVARLLGEPALVRRDPPAEVWQYRSADCVLDLFLYEGPEGPRVRYLEARTTRAEPASTAGCVGSLLTARAAPQTG